MTLPELEQEILGEFDDYFPNDEGLFNTESGWRLRADPKKLKSFLLAAIRKTAEKTREAVVPEMRKSELALDADGGDQIENDWSACVQEAEERYKRFIE